MVMHFYSPIYMKNRRKILVTTALVYANGPLHLGHIIEQIQADIWVRFQRLRGHDCLFLSGADAHGTPIMLSAQKEGITPEELITRNKRAHELDSAAFQISFDNYYTTHSPENEQLCHLFYQRLQERGDITTAVIEQAYDPEEGIFLPDRFIKGTCPRCHSLDQYGDSCEVCGATYSPLELKNPVSMLSGKSPILQKTEHEFFQLERYTKMLEQWVNHGHLQEQVANKLAEWFDVGLKPWDITRDAPYFGFLIPGKTDKYFYVWLDAPIGYLASFQNLAQKRNDLDFTEYWAKDSQTELYHFIGKDIIYFHALFWPALLEGVGFRKPTAIFAHGFVTIDGQKMSKSRGTFITVRDYLKHLKPDYLRYYFAAKLNSRVEDVDLNWADFKQRVNADLVGKVVNIASRCAKFINKQFANRLAARCEQSELIDSFIAAGDSIAQAFEAREYNKAVREIMELADQANYYIDQRQPWVLIKQEEMRAEVQSICTTGLNLFRILMTYLKPIVPDLAAASEDFLNCEPFSWNTYPTPLIDQEIKPFTPLLTRVQDEQITKLLTK